MALLRMNGSRKEDRRFPRGMDLLHSSRFNKGTAFSEEERDEHGLRGLLPPHVFSRDSQEARVMESYHRKTTDIEKYIFLISLQDRDERLFYRVATKHIEMMMPIIYTPEVGNACRNYAHIYRQPQGMYLTANDRGRMTSILRNWPEKDVRIIVVTDGERILGLGDLGANGMGISVGKLALYTICAGVDPALSLPITLDVGTENKELLDDPLYIGLRQPRLRGEVYDELVSEFVDAVNEVFPRAIIQFEDFGNQNAFRLLNHYRKLTCSFNDDIQGTAAVAAAGMFSAGRITGQALNDQRVLFLGAGEAAIGIADLLVDSMMHNGLPEAEARSRMWLVDSKGLVVKSRENLQEHKLPYAHDHEPIRNLDAAVKALKPTALIGVSGQPQTFTQPIIQMMAEYNEHPVVFALSNPTSMAECTAEQAYQWTQGRALFASGSPFDPVTLNGKRFVPGQCNNAYIFPGVGLGLIACGASRVSDRMFWAAAITLAKQVTQKSLDKGCLYPPLTEIRAVSFEIALAVAKLAYEEGVAQIPEPQDLAAHIRACVYDPEQENSVYDLVETT